MLLIREYRNKSDAGIDILTIFSRPWLAMLALGGLGHHTGIHAFFQSYWTVLLAFVVIRTFFGNNPVTKWRMSRERNPQ